MRNWGSNNSWIGCGNSAPDFTMDFLHENGLIHGGEARTKDYLAFS